MESVIKDNKSLNAIADRMVGLRRYLHQNAELSFQETGTQRKLISLLQENRIEYFPVAGTGVIAVVNGEKKCETHSKEIGDILIRADIDALPIVESVDVPYRSVNGVMHACGHDIHTAILMGTVLYLSQHKDFFSGRVVALFEPGEEMSPGGASIVLDEKILDRFNIKHAFALHSAHDLPVGSFGVKKGAYMASTNEIRIKVNGSGGHAALTTNISNPIHAAADIILSIKDLAKSEDSDNNPVIISIGKVEAKGATNIIPTEVYMEGTMRTMDEQYRKELRERVKHLCVSIASKYDTTADVDFNIGYPPVYNDPETTDKVASILKGIVGDNNVIDLKLRKTSDDFSLFSQIYPSTYFRLGVKHEGNNSPAEPHTPKFNPDDSSILYGITALSEIVKNFIDC